MNSTLSTRELDAVICPADADTRIDPSCQVLVPLDCRTGEPVRHTLWSFFARRDWKYYLVTNTHRLEAVAVRRNLKIAVEDFARDWRFDLFLDYEARCPPGREVRVAQALGQGLAPQERLDSLLKGWVLHLLDGRAAEFVRSFDRSAETLAQDLRSRAREQAGLTLAVRVRLDEADRLDSLSVGPLNLPIRVRDREDELDLRVEAELVVESGKERVAYLHRDRSESLEKDLRRRLREHFAANVSLQQFHAELSGRIHSELMRHIDDLAAPYGRKVVRLHLGGEALPGVIESRKVEHTFTHRLRDYPDPVQVKTELLLQLTDLGRFVRARTPDLDTWTRREVENVAIQCLFGVTYTELCLQYEEKKAEIESRMKDRAATIGYELKQLITVTDLQLDMLRKPFLIHLSGEFATRLAKLKIKLEVDVTLLIPHPSEIAPLLDRREDVKEQIRRTLSDRLQQKLHQINPESFYMEFEVAKGEEALAVRVQLEQSITASLKEEFHAVVLSLSCKQVDTELSLLLDRLMAQIHPFTVEVIDSRGGPAVIFDSTFRVNGVDENGWIAFQTSAPDAEKLSECAVRHLRHVLSDEAWGQLLQTSNTAQLERVDRWIGERMVVEFGLRVTVRDWTRRPLQEEQRAAQARLALAEDRIKEQETRIALAGSLRSTGLAMHEKTAQDRLDQMKKLQEKLARVLVAGSPDDEKHIRDQIARLQEDQRASLREATAERSLDVLPDLAVARGILTEGGTEADPDRKSPSEPNESKNRETPQS